ncbi:RNA polymerase sigma factor [Bacillaceae bacterium IKA-2]|nr:RNA polymerase sigma factor [Bacillaceae bacterium IKA-2]
MYKYVFFMIGDHNQAKDILQDTYLRAYNNFNTFNGENSKGWLFKIARNVTIDFVRKKKPISYLIDSIFSIPAPDKTPEQFIVLTEIERELYDALSKIKRSYRDVIIVRKLKEFSISESSHILGWSENKVKVNLFRGMKALKKQLEKESYHHETI